MKGSDPEIYSSVASSSRPLALRHGAQPLQLRPDGE
jgi:hypothetical protein